MTDEELGRWLRIEMGKATVEQTGAGKRVTFNGEGSFYAHVLLADLKAVVDGDDRPRWQRNQQPANLS